MMGRFRQVVIAGPGGPEVLVATDRAMLHPGLGQLLIRVTAAGVNRHDVNQRQAGHHHDGNPVPGLEVAGTIAGVGEGVTGWSEGDPVMALVQGGGYAEYALADAGVSLSPPAHLTLQEAAGLPEALFTTVWNFFHLMRLQPGETALIHGGTSGVGHLALQLLSRLGHTVVYATAGTPAKCAAARDFGAAMAFDYHAPDLSQQVLDATGGRGIDTLLDMSAGAHLESDLAVMAPGGRIAHLAPGKATVLSVPLRNLMEKRIAITGSLLRPLAPALKAQVAETLRDHLAKADTLRPHIAATFPLDQAAEAHRAMERGAHIGKILLIP